MLKVRDHAVIKTKERSRSIAEWISAALLAFVASTGKILGFPSPVNVVVAVISGANIIPAFIGSVLGYLIFGSIESGMVQLCSILVIAGVRLAVMQREQNENPIFLSMLTAGVMLLFSCVMSVAVPADAYTASLRMVTSLIAGCLVFIAQTLRQRYRCDEVVALSGINGAFAAILYIMTVCTLAAVPFPGLNPGRIFGAFVLLAAVKKYKTAGGAVAGALTTCGVLLCDPMLAGNTLLFATSGLICGAFMQFGVMVTVLVFIGISIISLVAIGVNGDTFYMFADLLAGSVLFVACPAPFIRKAAAKILGGRSSADIVGQTASSRLNFASKTLGEIRGQITLVSAAIDRKTGNAELSSQVCAAVCEECQLFNVCWKKNRENTAEAFESLEKIVIQYNGISMRDVEKALPMCAEQRFVADNFNELYKRLLAEKANNIKLKEMRELVTEQLCSMEDILSDLSYRVGQVRAIDSEMSAQVRDYFSQLGYPNAKCCVYIDENNSQRAEVYLTAQFRGDPVKLTMGISSIAECDFDVPVITKIENVTKMTFTELPGFTAETGTFQASCSDNGYSGDTLETIDVSTFEKYVILSDGMGTGKRAKLDSMFAVNLACRLLKAGISMPTVHRLINSILRVKGWEESFATLDFLRLDLCGGTAEFLKAGAAPAFLFRDGALKAIGGQAFPAGILADCSPDISDCKLFGGDMIIMSSDGVDENVIRKINSVIKEGFNKPQMIAQRLGELAMNSRPADKRDDITIAVIRIDLR